MPRLITLLVLVIVTIVVACSSSRPSINPFDYEVAWNENTVNNYTITFSKKGTFTYSITTKDSVKNTAETYKGTYGGVSNEIFLNFSGKKPNGLNPVLIIEASNNYYIQYFTDGRKRMFLRIHQWPHR